MQITQCPECHTAFKVSPEHLAVANGWVRCGRCGSVFEAIQHLESSSIDAPAPANPTVPVPTTHETPASESDIDAFHDSLMSFVPGSVSAQTSPAGVQPLVTSDVNTRSAWWLWPMTGLLSVALLLQLLFWNRHMMVAQEPALQGVMQALCAPVGCELRWPQTLDAVQIENSNFSENSDGSYRLQLRLKNTQHHVVEMPLLELTLTDAQDEVVLRRVFQPNELGLKDHLPALRDARSTLNFDLNEDLKPRVVGFRALIFYP